MVVQIYPIMVLPQMHSVLGHKWDLLEPSKIFNPQSRIHEDHLTCCTFITKRLALLVISSSFSLFLFVGGTCRDV